MQNFLLGEYIRQRRLDLGLTQAEVCSGICEPITLSRLENGRQTPSRNRINAILQRLGLPDDRYYALLSPDELKIEALKKEIIGCNVTERVEEGFDKIAELERIAGADDPLVQQFVLRSKVLLGRIDGRYSSKEQFEMLKQAIQLTVPRFNLWEIEKFLYTTDEIKIINQIAIVYSDIGDNKRAAEIYYQVLRYMKKHFDENVTSAGNWPLILYNYARVLDLCHRYEEGAECAKECREKCVKYGHYQCLPDCLEIEAECKFFLGKAKESIDLYRQAYYLCKVIGYQDSLAIIKKEAKEYLNIEFED